MSNDIRPRSASTDRVVLHSVIFVALLVALNSISITLLPDSYQEVLRQATGRMAASLLQPFGETTFDGLLLTTGGFTMEIAVECTALQFLMIYIAGVVAYPHHGARYKVFGIASGTTVLFLINAVRIAVLGLAGSHVPAAFYFLHIYLWQGMFALLVVGTWIVWVRKPTEGRHPVMKIGIAAAVSAVGVGILNAAMPAYLEALTVIARPIATLLIDRTLSDLAVSGDIVELNYGKTSVLTSVISINVYNQGIFLALMATSFGKGRALETLKRTVYGLGILFLVSLGHVMLFILAVSNEMPLTTIDIYDVAVRTFSVGICIGLAVVFNRKLRENGHTIYVDLKGGSKNEEIVIAR